ncbi:unnamed protein product [Withania somnifera]
MNGIPSSTYLFLATTSWLGMGDVATKEAFGWILTEPTILVASCIIARLLNDLIELERGDVASSIECYMNEYDATEEEAYMEIREIIGNRWKDLNRGSEFIYKDEDAYNFSKNNLKDVISMVLIEPITA